MSMKGLQLCTTVWMNVTTIMLREGSQVQAMGFHHKKFKNGQNEFMVLKIRRVATLGRVVFRGGSMGLSAYGSRSVS